MKIKLKFLIDGFFAFILFISLFTALFRSLTNGVTLSLACLILSLLSTKLYLSNGEKSRSNYREIENLKNAFIFTPISVVDLFFSAFAKRYKVEKHEDCLIVNKTCVVFSFSISPLSYASVASFYRNKKANRLLILCFSADKQSKRLALRLPQKTQIWQISEVYKFLKTFDALPPSSFSFTKKTDWKTLIKTGNSPRLSKAYILSSIVILAFSSFTPFGTYYTVFAIFTLALALLPPLLKALVK